MSKKTKSSISQDEEEAIFRRLLKEKVESARKFEQTKSSLKDTHDESEDDEVSIEQLKSKAKAKPKSPKQVEHLAKAREAKKLKTEEKKRIKEKEIAQLIKKESEKKLSGGSRIVKTDTTPIPKTQVYTPKAKTIEASTKELEREQEKEDEKALMAEFMKRYEGVFG